LYSAQMTYVMIGWVWFCVVLCVSLLYGYTCGITKNLRLWPVCNRKLNNKCI